MTGIAICASEQAFSQVGEFPPIPQTMPEGSQVVIRAVRDLNPQTPVELANALSTMLDLEEPTFARYYLARLQALNLDDQAKFEIYQALGSAFFLSLHADETMQPEGRDFARQVLAASHAEATRPERIQQLIGRLSDSDASVRATAVRTLRRLGPISTAEIIHIFTDPAREQEFPFLRNALRAMGDDAIPPLMAGARADHPQVQAECIRALANYRSSEVNNVMMRAYLSTKTPEALRRVALDVLMRNEGALPDPKFVEDRFYSQATELLTGQRTLARGLLGTVTHWSWDADNQRLVSAEVPTATATRNAAAQIAADLHEIQPKSPRNRALHLLTHLESTKRTTGPSQPLTSESFEKSFGHVEIAELEQTLTEALNLGLIPAATACCELLGQLGTVDLLDSAGQRPRPLVEAVLTGDRYLQFAVLEAIDKLDPQQAYAGSSYVFSLAVFLASSQGSEAGIVGDNREDIAQSYAAMMASERLLGMSATTGQELFSKATECPDIEVVVITDNLQRPSYLELIQQLRNDLRTKRLPIALLVREPESHLRLQRVTANDPLFLFLPMTLDSEQVWTQIRLVKALSAPWSIEILDRQHHASVAIDWLKKIAKDRTLYRFYDWGSREREFARILYLPGMSESGSEILKALGTPAAQRELLNFVSQSNFPLESRQAAANAFAESLKTGGALLTREEILKQYDRYNASALEPEETQKLLGAILDALEARIGRK